jgi:hypothetical protein
MNRLLAQPLARPLLVLAIVAPLLWLLHGAATDRLGANPAEALIRASGEWTLRLLCLTVGATAARHDNCCVKRHVAKSTINPALTHSFAQEVGSVEVGSEDRSRVAVLRAAAEALGLTVHLALAEIHEQWTATVAYRGRRGGAEQPQREELIDEGMVLDFWVDADDRPLRREALRVALADSPSFSDTDESFLVDEEHEGYMGNYGETLDDWYRRAALVIQTPLAAESSRFITDFDTALADALALAHGGRGDELAQRLRAAARSLDAQRHTRGRRLLDAYATLATALPDTTVTHRPARRAASRRRGASGARSARRIPRRAWARPAPARPGRPARRGRAASAARGRRGARRG